MKNRKTALIILLVVNVLYTAWFYRYGQGATGMTKNIEIAINIILWGGWLYYWTRKEKPGSGVQK